MLLVNSLAFLQLGRLLVPVRRIVLLLASRSSCASSVSHLWTIGRMTIPGTTNAQWNITHTNQKSPMKKVAMNSARSVRNT